MMYMAIATSLILVAPCHKGTDTLALTPINPKVQEAWNIEHGDSWALNASTLFRPGEALFDFNKAIKIDANYADAYYWRGLTNLESSLKQSVEDFSMAIGLNPDNDQYYLDRSSAHAMLENYAAAKIDLTSSIKIKPGNVLAHKHLEIFNELLNGRIDGIEVKRKTWDNYLILNVGIDI